MRCWMTPGGDMLVEWALSPSGVLRPDGTPLADAGAWPWMGKGLYRRLDRVARERYGDRLEAFEVDVPEDEYLRFDND